MDLCNYRLLVDFALLILIWIVQLIIYPSFTHFSKDDLVEWHRKYTTLMGYIVAPFMVGQLVIYGVTVFSTFSVMNVIAFVLVLATWGITFFQFVPMHGLISKGHGDEKLLRDLVIKNWSRTIIWSLLFMMGSFICL